MRKQIILVALASFLVTTAFGQIGVEIDVPSNGFATRVERKRFAADLVRFFDGINSKIPNLKPSEKEWLLAEKARISKIPDKGTERATQILILMDSRESRTAIIKEGLDQIAGEFKRLVNDEYLSFTNRFGHRFITPYSEENEIIQWLDVTADVLIANAFHELKSAQRNGLEMPDTNITIGRYFTAPAGIAETITGSINYYVVRPHLYRKWSNLPPTLNTATLVETNSKAK